MKKKLKISLDKINIIANKTPFFLILLLIIFLAPLGVSFFVKKSKNKKTKLYNKSKNLAWLGIFVLFLIGVGIYTKIKEIIVLFDSGMSLDMINIFPDNIWLYIVGIIMCVSYLYGAKMLLNQAKIEKEYIKYINIKKEQSINKISKSLLSDVKEVKRNIRILESLGYLVPIEIDDKKNKIIYIKTNKFEVTGNNKNNKLNKTVQCAKCGAIISLKLEEYVECDFCGHGLIDENNL